MASMNTILSRHAQCIGNNVSTVDISNNRTQTYKEMVGNISRVAHGLKKAGFSKDSRLAIISMNSDRYFESYFSASWADGIIVPLNIRLAAPELVNYLNDAGVEFLMVDKVFAKMLPAFEGKVPSLKVTIYLDDDTPPPKCVPYKALLENDPIPSAYRANDDIFGIFFTSGSTSGRGKGVMLTHLNFFANAVGHFAMARTSQKSVYLNSAPMFHLANSAFMLGTLIAGGTNVFIEKFDPIAFFSAIHSHKVTHAMTVPVMLTMLLNLPERKNYDFSSLKAIVYGGSPMPDALLVPAMELFPKAAWFQGFGATEAIPITMLTEEFHSAGNPKLRSAGRPLPWVEVEIHDDNGNPVPVGTVGEIVTRGPHVMKGYWNMEKKTKETINQNGFLATGDLGRLDEDGFVFIVDRKKDMIISGGENIYAAEVENTIAKMEGVLMSAVIGKPDSKFGQLCTAFVVPKPDYKDKITQDKVVDHCRSLIAGYKAPREVYIRESLPISGSGKVLKPELRKEFQVDALGHAQL